MRCKNCGWSNPDGLSRCEKCGATLALSAPKSYGSPESNSSASSAMSSGKASSRCPNCGYPLLPGASRCPVCGTSVVSNAAPQAQTIPSQDVNPLHATVREGGMPMPNMQQSAHCTLQAIRRADEVEEFAELTYENGHWYIVDKSDAQSTFLHASRKMPIEDGDVILMGNRKFIFHNE